MNLLDKGLNLVGLTRTKAAAGGVPVHVLLTPGQWFWPDDNKNLYIEQGYRELPNLYSIISLITQKSSVVPFEVFKVTSQTKYRRYKAKMAEARSAKEYAEGMQIKAQALELVENTELEALLNNPNNSESTEQMFEQLDGYKLLTGNSYLWGWTPGVGPNALKPTQLHVPPATMVTIVTGDMDNPVKEYKFNFLKEGIPYTDIAHFKTWNPLTSNNNPHDKLYGMSPLMSCRRLMKKYKAADTAQGKMFTNMTPAGMMTGDGHSDGSFQEEEAQALKDKYDNVYKGQTGEIIITSANLKWTQIGLSPVDLNILEGKEEILGELCNIYHVPIGLFTKVNSTENNMVESRKMMITDAVIPLVESRKQTLNRWLTPKFDDNLVIEFDYSVFSEIAEETTKLAESLSKSWWITPNEKRLASGYDKMDGEEMDKIYIPMGFDSLENLNNPAQDIDPAQFLEENNTVLEQVEEDDDEKGLRRLKWKALKDFIDLTKHPLYSPNAKPGEVGYLDPADGMLIVEIVEL